MTEQLTGLAGYELFRYKPHWADEITVEYGITRQVLEFTATMQKLITVSDKEQVKISAAFLLQERQAAFELLAFWHACKSRVIPFWMPSTLANFTLVGDQLLGANYLTVIQNRFLAKFFGHERVFVRNKLDEFYTYQITAVENGADELDPIRLYISEVLNQTLAEDDIELCGLLYFMRFDVDKLEFIYHTDNTIAVNIDFLELPEEYPA